MEVVTEVYDTLTLVSGATEFVNFGSTEAIDEYFRGKKVSSSLQSLLDAMRSFSDAIRVCRVGEVERLLSALGRKIRRFRESGGDSLQEALFRQILDVVQKEYGCLLTGGDKLDIIRWCIRKNLIQQAMTFCTEWLLQKIVYRKIYYTDDPEIRSYCRNLGESLRRTWDQSFIMSYRSPVCSAMRSVLKCTPANCIRNALSRYKETKDIETALLECPAEASHLRPFLMEYENQGMNFEMALTGSIEDNELKRCYPQLVRSATMVWEKNKKNKTYQKDWPECRRGLTGEKILNEILGAPEGMLLDLFGISAQDKTAAADRRYYEASLRDGANSGIQSRCAELAPDVLIAYQKIRNARNQMNHANETKTLSSDELIGLMEDCLDKIKAALDKIEEAKKKE